MRAAALPRLLYAAVLAMLLLLAAPGGVRAQDRRDAAFPGYKEEAAPECADQLGAAICEVRRQQGAGVGRGCSALGGSGGGSGPALLL